MVQVHHDGDFLEQFLKQVFSQLVLVYFLGCPVHARVDSLDLVYRSVVPLADFVDDLVITEEVAFLHFYELVPLYLHRLKPFVELVEAAVHI